MKTIEKQIKEAHIKSTKAIQEVLSVLQNFSEPQPVSEIIKQLDNNVHIATIYRILEKLSKPGIINKLQFNDQKFFYELNKEKHHHFICTNCKKVLDIKIEEEILPTEKNIENNYQIHIDESMIQFSGQCSDCKI